MLNFARTSLRAQTVVLFMLLVVFATSAMVTAGIVGRASDFTQAQQVQLITWRYDTALLSLAAQELRTNLAQMNNSLLGGDAQGAKSYQTLAETNIQFIDSEISLISALNLPSDAVAVTTQDADAFRALTTFARQFIALVGDQVLGQRADRIGAQAAAVERWIQIDVNARVAVIKLGLGTPLDRAGQAAIVLDDERVGVRVAQVRGDLRCHVALAPPPPMHLRRRPDRGQRRNVTGCGRSQRYQSAAQHRLP